MHFLTIVLSLFGRGSRPGRKSVRYRPGVTALEGRWLPSTLTEFLLPPLSSGASYGVTAITSGSDGNLWFTDLAAGAIGRITPAGQVTEFKPSFGGAGNAITTGPDGNVWATGEAFAFAPSINRVTPAGQSTSFMVGDTLGSINALTAGPDGNVWFIENVYPFRVEKVGRITPAGQITTYSIAAPSGVRGSIGGITTGPDGNLWFTHDGTLAMITPTGAIRDHVVDDVRAALTTGPDGNLWASGPRFDPPTGLFAGDFIQRISLTGAVTTFNVGTFNITASPIAAGPDGNLWFTEPDVNQVGRITPAGQITLFSAPTPGSKPTGIVAGPNGNVWFTEAASRHIGEVFLTGTPPAPAAATTTTLAADLALSSVGQTVHLTATVTSTTGTPAGSVTFFDGTTALGTANLDTGGRAVFATAFGTAGSHALSAVYGGTAVFAPSASAVVRETVGQSGTTTTLTASANPAPVGQSLVLSVTVTPTFTGAGAPTGTVILRDGRTTLGFATLDASGRATFTFIPGQTFGTGSSRHTVLPRGKHTLTVSYTGDGNFAASVSASLGLTVV